MRIKYKVRLAEVFVTVQSLRFPSYSSVVEMVNAKAQDLPPPGGYEGIRFKRVPARTLFNGYQIFGGYIAMTAAAMYIFSITYKKIKREEVEMRSSKLALLPVLISERDREYLKQVRRNRDEEANLMKNVPGWKVGTWYGEKIFKTKQGDYLPEGTWDELTVHASWWDGAIRTDFHLWN